MIEPRPKPIQNTDGTITFYLLHGYTCTVDEVDADLAEHNWFPHFVKDSNLIYTRRTQNISTKPKVSKCVFIHRVILERILGRVLTRRDLVDHEDRNGLNNVRTNLRLATVSQNTQNQKKRINSLSPFKGVTWHKQAQKWQAVISCAGKQQYLGLFNDPYTAHEAYKLKAVELFGEFARFE